MALKKSFGAFYFFCLLGASGSLVDFVVWSPASAVFCCTTLYCSHSWTIRISRGGTSCALSNLIDDLTSDWLWKYVNFSAEEKKMQKCSFIFPITVSSWTAGMERWRWEAEVDEGRSVNLMYCVWERESERGERRETERLRYTFNVCVNVFLAGKMNRAAGLSYLLLKSRSSPADQQASGLIMYLQSKNIHPDTVPPPPHLCRPLTAYHLWFFIWFSVFFLWRWSEGIFINCFGCYRLGISGAVFSRI